MKPLPTSSTERCALPALALLLALCAVASLCVGAVGVAPGEVLRALTKIQSEFEACEQSSRQVRQRLAQAVDALDTLDARNRKFARALRELSDGEDGE